MKVFRISTVPISLNLLLKGQLNFLNKFYQITAISGSGADLETVKNREGVRILAINFERSISPFKDLISLYKLWLCFKKEKPVIVHSITPKAGLITMVAGKIAGVPIRIHTFTGLIFPSKTGLMQSLLKNMDRLLCVCSTHIYPEGEGVKNDLITHKITKRPLKIIANGNVNGIDTAYYSKSNFPESQLRELKSLLKINETDFVFIFVGRLVGDKGINELIKAFTTLEIKSSAFFKINQIKLILVGSTEDDLDPLKLETINEIDANPNIISVGFQDDVRPFYAVSNALVFPSYREGFPNVVMQAGAMELPSIVTNINGSNEIIINGTNGLIVPSKNVASLRFAISQLVEDKLLYTNLKEQARLLITTRYEQEVVWQAILNEYKSLIDV